MKAMRWLLAHGVLRRVGTYRRMALFLPGAGPAHRRSGGPASNMATTDSVGSVAATSL
jgi:hypothetical protein